MQQARITFRKYQVATVTIQKTWRAQKQQKRYKATIQKVVLVQAVVRCHLAVHHFKRMKQAATLIQSHWRGYVNRTLYQQSVASIVKIQAHIRR
jgi:myosin-5